MTLTDISDTMSDTLPPNEVELEHSEAGHSYTRGDWLHNPTHARQTETWLAY